MNALPRLHVITDDTIIAAPAFADRACAVLWTAGARIALHLRGHATPARRLFQFAEVLLPAAQEAGALLLLNDRVDVALAAGAHGVQLGARSIPVPAARSLLGPRRIGYSAHATAEAVSAAEAGTDFVILGTIYPSATHPSSDATGVDPVAQTVRSARVPVLAIGGVTPGRVAELSLAGAYGIAVLGGVWHAPQPDRSVLEYLNALDDHASQWSPHAGNGKHRGERER